MEHGARSLELNAQIRIVPSTANVSGYYCAMDTFALTSREDPFLLVVLEAAEHGVPTVCFEGAGGAVEFISGDAGAAVPYLDLAAFAAQLERLRDTESLSPAWRMAAKGHTTGNLAMSTYPFSVVAAVNDHKVLQENLLRSPDIADGSYRVLIKEGFTSASLAYNSAIDEAPTDTLIFVHQDVYLPSHWFAKVAAAIRKLDDADVRWGVVGSFGSRHGAAGGLGRVYTTGLGLHGTPIREPVVVETLDEIVLIIRKSSGLRFDRALPHFHLYGTDICLHARDTGLINFAIPAHCVHNTNQLIKLPPEFFTGYHFIKRKWKKFLPIYASCMTISRFDKELRERQVRQRLARVRGPLKSPLLRVDDPRPLVAIESHAETTSDGYGVRIAGGR